MMACRRASTSSDVQDRRSEFWLISRPETDTPPALAALAGYLSLSIYTYVCTIVKEEFCLTYGKLGPTEFRLLLILLNILYMYTSWSEWRINWYGLEWGIFDILGIIITIILFSIYIAQFIKDRAAFAKQDPLKPHNKR